jgi:hypothetical protein
MIQQALFVRTHLVEIIIVRILPIGNAPDIVMVLVVIGQVEKNSNRQKNCPSSDNKDMDRECHGLRVGRVTSCKLGYKRGRALD